MEHKAQRALDTLKGGLGVISYLLTKNESKEPLSNKYTNEIQRLIDCQLTVEEIEWILQQATFYKSAGVTKERIKLCESIIDKIHKQKEMWVSDDEAVKKMEELNNEK